MSMEEIRWGVGHTAIMAEDPTLFTADDIDVIMSRATWLAPADCSFALYDACKNECNEGYGVSMPGQMTRQGVHNPDDAFVGEPQSWS